MNFQLANSNKDTLRAACKKCGYAGHLTYQCRNFLKVSKANAAKRTYLSTITATTTERRREEKERIEELKLLLTRVTLRYVPFLLSSHHSGGSEQRDSVGRGKYQFGLGARLPDAAYRAARTGAERQCRHCTRRDSDGGNNNSRCHKEIIIIV